MVQQNRGTHDGVGGFMCSIIGMGFVKGHTMESETVKTIVKDLMIAGMSRGRDASGVAFTTLNNVSVVKKNVSAREFLDLPEYKDAADNNIKFDNSPLLSITGHCRAQTKGCHTIRHNNHPIIRKNVVGVHNGHINNDDVLFTMHDDNISRKGQVDSEIIFALIEHYADASPNSGIHRAIASAVKTMSGGFACAMVHTKHPHIIWLFRRANPCDVVLFEDAGVVMYASHENFIKDSVKDKDLGLATKIDFPINSGMAIDLHRNKMYKFSLI